MQYEISITGAGTTRDIIESLKRIIISLQGKEHIDNGELPFELEGAALFTSVKELG